MKKEMKLLAMLLVAINLISLAAAFGVSSSYGGTTVLTLLPGETQEVALTMQNMVGDEDLTIRVALEQGQEVATLLGPSEYEVKLGTKVPVKLNVSIPEDAEPETEYSVIATFTTVKSGESEGVALGTAIESSFNVVVGAPEAEEAEKPALEAWQTALLVIAVIIILILLWYLLRKKK